MSSFTIPAFFGKLSMGTSPLPVLRQRKAKKREGKRKEQKKHPQKTKTKKQNQTDKQTNKEKERERKKNTCLKRFRTHELCHILGQCIAYCMHVVHTVHTLFFLNVRMLVFRARLNVLIFLPNLTCSILVLFLNYN